MALRLPVNPTLAHSSFEVVLDGATYTLEFRWNERAAAWFFSVYDAAGALLVVRKVVLSGPDNFRLLGRFRDARLPLGDFLAVDTSQTWVEPGLGDLGARVEFIYLEAADFAAIDAEAA